MKDTRPKWMRVILNILICYWALLICFLLSAFVLILVSSIFIEDCIEGKVPVLITVGVASLISIFSVIKLFPIQKRILAEKSRKFNFILLSILLFLSLLFQPTFFISFDADGMEQMTQETIEKEGLNN